MENMLIEVTLSNPITFFFIAASSQLTECILVPEE